MRLAVALKVQIERVTLDEVQKNGADGGLWNLEVSWYGQMTTRCPIPVGYIVKSIVAFHGFMNAQIRGTSLPLDGNFFQP